jgi:hypothetical protein
MQREEAVPSTDYDISKTAGECKILQLFGGMIRK